jgi:hypothetical protein
LAVKALFIPASAPEGLRYAIEEMTEPKLMVMNLR